MQPKPQIVDLPVYEPGRTVEQVKQEFGVDNIVKLASNENPFGCSPTVKEALINEFEHTAVYPDGASVELTKALSAHYGIDPGQIIFGAGSDEVLLMTARAFLQPGDETIMAETTFPQYKHNSTIEGANIIEVPLQDGKHDLEAMLAKVTASTKIVWICNPNNPTGTYNTETEVVQFMDRISKDVLVVLDEAYLEYAVATDYPDSLSLLEQYPNLLLLRTFSKIYGLASLRIGYGLGSKSLIHSINQVREPFNTTRYAQAAALAALQDQAFIDRCRELNRVGMDYLTSCFEQLGFSYFPSQGNFIMVDVKRPGQAMFQSLLRRGVIVRAGHLPTYLRVTIGSREQNEAFIEALKEALAEIEVGV